MKKPLISLLLIFSFCTDYNGQNFEDQFDDYNKAFSLTYSTISDAIYEKEISNQNEFESLVLKEFKFQDADEFNFKNVSADSSVLREFNSLIYLLEVNGYSNHEELVTSFINGLDTKTELSRDQLEKLVLYSSFLTTTIDFVLQNEVFIVDLITSTKQKRPSAGECLLGMLGDGLTYGIAGAGVGCAVGGAAGAVATAGPGAAPGCVTGASVGALVGFIGGLFSGAADHCFDDK